MKDSRIVYGAGCTWWDSISEVSKTVTGLPCCPHCGSVLFEVPSEERWWSGVRAHESLGNPGYEDMIRWAQGKCYKGFEELKTAYTDATA